VADARERRRAWLSILTEGGRGMDAIKLLKQDHATVKDLFTKYEATGDRAYKTRRKIVDGIVTELSVHAAIEEQVFYPGVRKGAPDAEDIVLESLEEHHIVKWTCSELDGMDPQDERFDPKVRVLMESVRHHIKEEESEMFPKVRKALSAAQLRDLGEQLEEAKAVAPTKPHPRAPDTPPGNLAAGSVSAIVDAGRDLVGGVVEGVKGRGGS
jgi:hemerythrin superfamily protein